MFVLKMGKTVHYTVSRQWDNQEESVLQTSGICDMNAKNWAGALKAALFQSNISHGLLEIICSVQNQ